MMKNLLLLGLAVTAGLGVANAQKANLRGMKLEAVPVATQLEGDAYFTGTRTPQTPTTKKNNKTMIAGSYGTQIGHTYYDLPTNSSIANRIYRNPTDGTISVSWTETCDPNTSPSFPNRGAGYNYWNGTTWIHGSTANPREFFGTCNEPAGVNGPAFGIASKRVGWPEIFHVGAAAPFKEMVITHNSTAINVTSRTPKGTGGMAAWSATTDLAFTTNIGGVTGNNGTWPRAQASGNNIHMIYAINNTPVPNINGVDGPFVYSRSTDGGTTWDKQNIFLPGMVGVRNTTNPTAINTEGFTRIGGDGYALAVKGNTVAIVSGYFGNAWTLWKSTDNGNTFTRRVIKKLGVADTSIINAAADTVAFANDNSHAVVIDNNNVVHVFGGEILIKLKTFNGGTTVVAGDSWYPNAGRALLYWNDGMAPGATPQTIAEIEDTKPTGDPLDCVGTGVASAKRTPYGTLSLVSMANAAVDAQNNIYVVYTGAVEGATNNQACDGQPYRDIYIKKRLAAQGGKWSKSVNIARTISIPGFAPGSSTAENLEESVFPSVNHEVGSDNKVHITFMSDFEPGMNLGADADNEVENAIMYYAFDANYWQLNLVGVKEDMAAYVNKVSAYPNPTTGAFKIAVDLKQNANVQVKVMNALGQEVANVAPAAMAAGKNEVSVDMANLAAGVYMYTVTSDNFTVTQRIVKQ